MLHIENLTVVYPDKTKAIDSLSLSVGEGENVALIGGNGAGKTTLLHTLTGLLEPMCGTVEAGGTRLSGRTVREIRRRVGLVFQNPDDQLFTPLIYDDVAFGCRHLGWPEDAVRARVEETLEELGIGHLRERSPLRLSAGEKRMAAIATVLAMKPSILLFDEPTAFLDHRARRALAEALGRLPHTKVIATHDMAFAAETCGRVVALKSGRVAADGDLSLLYDGAAMERCGLEALKRL